MDFQQVYPPVVLPGQWRPDRAVAGMLSGRTGPKPLRLSWTPVRGAGLGQTAAKETPAEFVISTSTAVGAMVAGFAVAFMAPKQATTWKWIGAISGTIGLLKLLQTASKLG